MKAEDLMIGDWVRVADDDTDAFFDARVGTLTRVENIYLVPPGEEMAQPFSIDCVEPIPITPEILEKNGFEMVKWKEDEPAGLLGKWWDNRGQVLVKRFDFTLLGEVYSVKANNSRISNIRYVHELQHALRLCGIDKTIEL